MPLSPAVPFSTRVSAEMKPPLGRDSSGSIHTAAGQSKILHVCGRLNYFSRIFPPQVHFFSCKIRLAVRILSRRLVLPKASVSKVEIKSCRVAPCCGVPNCPKSVDYAYYLAQGQDGTHAECFGCLAHAACDEEPAVCSCSPKSRARNLNLSQISKSH